MTSQAAEEAAVNSASIVESATIDYFLLYQETTPSPRKNAYAEIDLGSSRWLAKSECKFLKLQI